ncbi:unnamed protein product [Rotaria sp. Silwood1]|nr:unnamed protein product [Rotaria sp. Silwood1]CAF1085303.1 unnamed protein product [Rotaria sp. Silwood1]CAF1107581.1 unnamed protein product [Rotaria sp. Silwood1]CAF3443808.1 unnamed protein product [Rotaria sp. Silwood1]CAF4622035.1 unnamed protein product [Rotaria sp. Silwood1]
MHTSSLFFFAIVLIIALYTIPITGKPAKKPGAPPAATTTTLATTTKPPTTAKSPSKVPAAKPASKVGKKKKKPGKKSSKPKTNHWTVPNADQKKIFNDYKAILRKKLIARKHNISATYQLEPAKYGSQDLGKTILHHYLIKLPDSKYAHAIIGIIKDAKKPAPVNDDHASIRRTVYDNLEAAAEI